jgi:hypothetical protein
MTIAIELNSEDEARLTQKASIAGVDVPTYVERILHVEASRPPLDAILKPIRDAFDQSGMTGEELDDLLVKAKKEMRKDRKKRQP